MDQYDRNSRLKPALLVILPAALAVVALAPDAVLGWSGGIALIFQLGGSPPGLGAIGADRSKLDQALDSMLVRPELAFTPEPPSREDLEELIERAW